MFQRAAAELCDESGGDGWTANTHTVQAPPEINSGSHRYEQGALMFIYNICTKKTITLSQEELAKHTGTGQFLNS